MNFEEFREFTETKFDADWTLTPVEWENVPESDALLAAKEAKTPWVRFTIRDGDGDRQTIGSSSRLNRYVGALIVQVFVAQKTGTATARTYAGLIAAIWDGYAGEPCLEFGPASITVAGETEGWFQFNVTTPFKNDDLTS